MVLNIYLIRHAETDFNKENSGFLQEDTINLNSNGLKQIEYLSERLKRVKFDRIYSSNLQRALQTADTIFRNRKVISDKRIGEYIHGNFSPDSEEWKNEYQRLSSLGIPREEIRPFGGENIWDFIKRIKSFIEDIQKFNGTLAIISHSGVNEVFMNLIQKREKENFLKLKQDNACINILKYDGKNWYIKTMNDTRHIEVMEPEIESFVNLEDVKKSLGEFLTKEGFNINDFYLAGNFSNGMVGKYKEVYKRYSGTPIVLISKEVIKVNPSWKIVCLLEDEVEYNLGEIIFENIKYKINLIVTKTQIA